MKALSRSTALRPLRSECSASELDDHRHAPAQHVGRDVLLELPECRLATTREEIRDRHPGAVLDERVNGEERPSEPGRKNRTERRLAGAHEADERDVTVERVQCRVCQPMRSR